MNKFQKLYNTEEQSDVEELEVSTPAKKSDICKEYAVFWKKCRIQESTYLSFQQKYGRLLIGAVCAAGIVSVCICFASGVFSRNSNENNQENIAAASQNAEESKDTYKNNKDSSTAGMNTATPAEASKKTKKKNKTKKNKTRATFKKGDIVYFSGKLQYKSSQSNKDKALCPKGKVEITKINKNGKHKYHVKGIKTSEYTYGWVDEKYIKKIG